MQAANSASMHPSMKMQIKELSRSYILSICDPPDGAISKLEKG
jgi:hypothetical protein